MLSIKCIKLKITFLLFEERVRTFFFRLFSQKRYLSRRGEEKKPMGKCFEIQTLIGKSICFAPSL